MYWGDKKQNISRIIDIKEKNSSFWIELSQGYEKTPAELLFKQKAEL